ncbi:OsmC family protein [Streptomyces sp. NBC_00853]|uniref:OsmC family protein n=1 Tax=Streptomyces sp. NBC_00853 TaxID=2903681 RepID=UPI00387386FB|nr:OsmC family protein [Streptomyces sp. NBC_00853]
MTDTAPEGTGKRLPGEAHRLEVTHVEGDVYVVDVRGHRLRVDQPTNAGGADTAPTPTELFAASLATCIAFYAGRYLLRHGMPCDGLGVRAEFVMATDCPARVAAVRMVIVPPPQLPEERRTGPSRRRLALHRPQHAPAIAGHRHRARTVAAPLTRRPDRHPRPGPRRRRFRRQVVVRRPCGYFARRPRWVSSSHRVPWSIVNSTSHTSR